MECYGKEQKYVEMGFVIDLHNSHILCFCFVICVHINSFCVDTCSPILRVFKLLPWSG